MMKIVSAFCLSFVFGLHSFAQDPGIVNLKNGKAQLGYPVISLEGQGFDAVNINLQYTSGIRSNQQSSWVGLGWSMGVGAIVRSINGYPDDYKGWISDAEVQTIKSTITVNKNEHVNQGTTETIAPRGDVIRLSSLLNGQVATIGNGAYSQTFNMKRRGNDDVNGFIYGSLHAKDVGTGYSGASPSNTRYLEHYDLYPDGVEDYELGALETGLGGTIIDVDDYFISGLGFQAEASPVILDNPSLFKKNSPTQSKYYGEPNISSNKPFFRVKNEFSNYYEILNEKYEWFSARGSSYTGQGYDFNNITEGHTAENRLTTVIHIEYFTNQEILNGSAHTNFGFINYQGSQSIDREFFSYTPEEEVLPNNYNVKNLVGGFMVTTANGISYHYALPVYKYDDYTWSLNPGKELVHNLTQTFTRAPYASSWLLTAVTSADYEDLNENGTLDNNDAGTWVVFEYGKNDGDYIERIPKSGFKNDIDGSYDIQFFKTQSYYLDEIKNKNGSLLFFKSIKDDNPSFSKYDLTPDVSALINGRIASPAQFNAGDKLRLDRIAYVTNDALEQIAIEKGIAVVDVLSDLKGSQTYLSEDAYQTDRLLLNKYIKKQATLEYDYELQPIQLSSSTQNTNGPIGGQLTLKSFTNYGYKEKVVQPPYLFDYTTDPNEKSWGNTNISHINVYGDNERQIRLDFGSTPNPYREGDIITFTQSNGLDVYVLLTKGINYYWISNALYDGLVLSKTIPSGADWGSYTSKTTLNPPNTYDTYDSWGYFKPDFVSKNIHSDVDRMTTELSASWGSAWSLRQVTEPNGNVTQINYEPHQFSESVYKNNYVFSFLPEVKYGHDLASLNVASSGIEIRPIYSSDFYIKLIPDNYNSMLANQLNTGEWYEFNAFLTSSFQNPITSGLQEHFAKVARWKAKLISQSATDVVLLIRAHDKDKNGVYGNFITPDGDSYPNTGYPVGHHRVHHLGSFLKIPIENNNNYAGGCRVKSVLNTASEGEQVTKNYNYNLKSSELSSGVVPFIPKGINDLKFKFDKEYFETLFANECDYVLEPCIITFGSAGNESNPNESYRYYSFQRALDRYYSLGIGELKQVISYSRFLPSGISYQQVEVSSVSNGLISPTSSRYTYRPLKRSDVAYTRDYSESVAIDGSLVRFGKVRVTNNTAVAGVLLKKETLDARGNTVAVNEYEYGTSEELPFLGLDKIGRIDQAFNKFFNYRHTGDTDTLYKEFTIFGESSYFLKSVTTRDLLKNRNTRSENTFFDELTGQILQSRIKNIYGEWVYSQSIPAYRLHPELGFKTNNQTNQHQLFASRATRSYKKIMASGIGQGGEAQPDKILSASVNVWDNNWTTTMWDETSSSSQSYSKQFWRPHKVYSWNSNESDSDGSLGGDFDWATIANGTETFISKTWKNVLMNNWVHQENNSFSLNGGIVSSKDQNGNYNSVLENTTNRRILAQSNAPLDYYVFTGAEELSQDQSLFIGEVEGADLRTTEKAHTGSASIKIPVGTVALKKTIPIDLPEATGDQLVLSYWLHQSNVGVEIELKLIKDDGTVVYAKEIPKSSARTSDQFGEWFLITTVLPSWEACKLDPNYNNSLIPTQWELSLKNTSGTEAYVDDYRIYPIKATMRSYVYDDLFNRVTHVLDGDNLYLRSEYDDRNVVKAIYKEIPSGEYKVKENNYNIVRK